MLKTKSPLGNTALAALSLLSFGGCNSVQPEPHTNPTAINHLAEDTLPAPKVAIERAQQFEETTKPNTPSQATLIAWENNMKEWGRKHSAALTKSGSSVYEDEHSILYYDGAEVFHLQSTYWQERDPAYAALARKTSEHLWQEYVKVYGPLGEGPEGYKKMSQWVFPASAQRKSASILHDMVSQSCYASYDDGIKEAYADSDARGLGYLLDAFAKYKSSTGRDVVRKKWDPARNTFVQNDQLVEMVRSVEKYCNHLGPQTPKTKEIFFQLGILGNALIDNKAILQQYTNVDALIKKMTQYLQPFLEEVTANQTRLPYGDGYINDGAGGNEAKAYYPGLEMIIFPLFQQHEENKPTAAQLVNYAVKKAPLSQAKDYVQHYRWSLQHLKK